jgi:bifunctional non-homologous end joining protein LigD
VPRRSDESRLPHADRLATYRAKRAVDRTPEPAGAAAKGGMSGGLFVVHKHAATRLHYDLRLEMRGVLESWAVPKGPSRNPHDKRLAVHVEPHPIEYGDFEGIIPEGNYGAGAVIVWDRGSWIPLEDPDAGMEKGKLLFDLRGYKLRGRWTLVRLKPKRQAREQGQGKDWLLIKERDGLVSTNGEDFVHGSVLSGLTVEELRDGNPRAGKIGRRLAQLKATRRRLAVGSVRLMLAETRQEPFSKAGWIYEIKYDGYRILAGRDAGEAQLLTRNANDATQTFPEVARAVRALPYDGLVLDGEVVCLDESGRPSFDQLQKRGRLTHGSEIRRAAVDYPATYFVFDLLGFEGFDLRSLPLIERKALLREVLPEAGALKYTDHVEARGEAFYEGLMDLRLEGMVAKQAAAPYRTGRSSEWLKVRADKTDDFVVVGFTQPKGSRSGFGALHVADFVDGLLTYAGRMGSGFTAAQLEPIRVALESARRPDPACVGPVPTGSDTVWIEPAVVCEVRYKEITGQGLLRQPVFLRFRDDKTPLECVRPGTGGLGAGNGQTDAPAVTSAPMRTASLSPLPLPEPADVPLSNVNKIFWPEDGYTKGELIAYYRAISPWLLPYLANRPLVLTRYPDGIAGKSFFQKDAPGFAPDWVRTERLWSEGSARELDYFVCDGEAALTYIINLGAIPLHIWGSRIGTLEQPDWCILDLDPKEAPFADVVSVARSIKALCDDIELSCFIKTSGSTGLHVLLPLGRQLTYEQTRQLGQLLARVVVGQLRDIATITRNPAKREGKVYVDFGQNGHGRLLVAPFSVRPLAGAPVSMPLKWSEVRSRLTLGKFTIKTAPVRMRKLGNDPLAGVLREQPDLHAVLGRLQERLARPARVQRSGPPRGS